MDFGVGGREAAERWLGVAERLLGARDLVGSKRFAERAMECDPLLDGVDQVLAVADVLLASQRRVNNHVDWYAVLQLPPPSGDRRVPDDPNALAAVRRQYRRLSLLLDPDRNRCPGAESAFVHVADAYAALSDPVKRSLFEDELRAESSANASPASDPASKTFPEAASDDALDEVFWTVCSSCCHVHQYAIEYLNRSLRCPSCNRPFVATELSAPPPVVPGTDMYYCAWGFFPLGFSGGPNIDLGSNWKPFYPMFPSDGKQPANAPAGGQQSAQNQTQTPTTGSKKRMATKKVGRPRKKPLNDGNNEKATGTAVPPDAMQGSGSRPVNLDGRGFTGININLGFDGSIGGGHGSAQGVNHPEPVNFHIDLDATDEIMGNLQNLPFLKDDGIPFRML